MALTTAFVSSIDWNYMRRSSDILYLVLLELTQKHQKKAVRRKTLLKSCMELKIPNKSKKDLSQALTRSTTRESGVLHGLMEVLVVEDPKYELWYRPRIRTGAWEVTSHYFLQALKRRQAEEKLKTIPDVSKQFYISQKNAVHGYGLFAKQRIPAGTRTWLLYMGGIYTVWSKRIPDSQISYQFEVSGMSCIVIDPTDEKGELSLENRRRFLAASINEARTKQTGKRANCFFVFDPNARWQIYVQVGAKRDIEADEELLVDTYGTNEVDAIK